MPRLFDRWDRLTFGVTGGLFAVMIGLYRRLPAAMPVHFDIHGHVDGYLPRPIALAIMPFAILSTWAIVRVVPRFMHPQARARIESSPASVVAACIALFMSALQLVMIRAALSPHVDVGPMIAVVLGVAWIGLGLVMPRLRRNPFMGVRVRWTLASDENWARTHRVAGITMTIGGVIATFLGLGGLVAASILVGIATTLVPVVYSFVLSRRHV